MVCCLNPECPQPLNPDSNDSCQACSTPLIPLLINRFRVLRVLSTEGGFGRTYLAEDTQKFNETCVLKQLAPKQKEFWAIEKAIELFPKEAKRLQDLGENPQIPFLSAYFEDNNFLYLVQQFIEGENLFKELEHNGRYNEDQIRELLLDLLPVLTFIHKRKVIHRDIKPQNIMRRKSDGRLVLIDFGIAKELITTVNMKIGTTIGSHGYSPLEQIQDGQAFPASDLFALGATCFHLLTEVHPYRLWSAHGFGWVNYWRNYLSSPISKELDQVLDKLLKKDFHDRYQSVDEVIKDLSLKPPQPKPAPIPVPPQPQPKPAPKPIKKTGKLKNRLLGILLLGFIGSQIYSVTRYGFFASPIFLIDSFPSSFFLEKTIKGNVFTLSADGKTLVSGSSYDIKLWNLSTGKEIRTLKGHDYVEAVVFGLNGKTLASVYSDNTIKLWNLATEQENRTLKGHSDQIFSITISPNNQTLVSGSKDHTIKLWNLSIGKEIRTLKHSGWVNSVAISPDGKTLISGSNHIKLLNLSTGEEIRTLQGYFKAFSPDGKLLASSLDGTIKLWNVATGEEIRTLKGHYYVHSVAFSPDGKTLVSGGYDSTIKIWRIAP